MTGILINPPPGKQRKNILESLGSSDPNYYQETTIKLRQPGTGVWFTEGLQFKEWLNGKNAKLWLYGIRKLPPTFLEPV
jgi:hypothetical protein